MLKIKMLKISFFTFELFKIEKKRKEKREKEEKLRVLVNSPHPKFFAPFFRKFGV